MDIRDYKRKHRITLGMKPADAINAMEEWLHRSAPCDITVRRAKTQGMVCFVADIVPETQATGLYWLSWCVQHYSCKVDVKEL